jgi:hypothetical protein
MDRIISKIKGWERSDTEIFWGEIAPVDHLVQFYETDDVFFKTLEGFVASGFSAGDAVVIIAVPSHREMLNKRLYERGFDVARLRGEDRYIELDAQDCLNKFLVNDWPDQTLFNEFVSELIRRGRGRKRKVRAFGEMVAVLWEQGKGGATVYLETLWHELHKTDMFSLYCAYPKSGFTQDANDSLLHICDHHAKIVSGNHPSHTEVYYQDSRR